MKNKKIRISASKGTVLADLLEYTQGLIKKGENTEQAHKLQAILQNGSVEPNKGENGLKMPLIIGGVLLVVFALIVGYFVGKRRKIN